MHFLYLSLSLNPCQLDLSNVATSVLHMCCSLLKYFFHFEFVVALWQRPLDKMICMSDEGITSIQTNKRRHTHPLRWSICWAPQSMPHFCLSMHWGKVLLPQMPPLLPCCLCCYCYGYAAATVLFLWPNANAISQGQVVQQTAAATTTKVTTTTSKKRTCNRIRQTFLLIRKSIAKSHLADDFSD